MASTALSAAGTGERVAGSGFMREVSALEGERCQISSASVVPPGMAAAIGGMALRWRWHRLEQADARDAPASTSRAARNSGAHDPGENRC